MFAFFNENKLEVLLTEFEKKYAIENRLAEILSYDKVLPNISAFNSVPDWSETIFLTKFQSLNIIPYYVNKREDYFSHDNRYSATLVEEKKIDEHYKSFSNAHPMAALFCNQLIKAILITELDSYIEGTTADGLGIAHIDFKEHFNQEDFNELIIHQITHMLLFIDDFIEPLVEDSHKQLPVRTAATHKRGGNLFPLYIFFHSLCVGIEVLNYRYNFQTLEAQVNYHPITSTAMQRCKDGFLILNDHINLFTLKGKKLLSSYGELLHKLDLEISHVA
ncbi:hypothetical protein [Legionella shakespearei]|uniref:HEXXH motif domain protein n=2 Tax=Legionella shakespearei TaxID=45075 RepID=A0A0W0YQV4_9GAMM|nr:hypothetical protein [Legionella shakespearei]KTD59282.1 hypothetical protein Lsha_1978 [Legionella shakespearei DSM 23087]